MSPLRHLGAALALGASTALAPAADFDGTRPFLCSTVEAHDCASGTACVRGLPQDLNLPPFVKVDFDGRTIGARGRTSPIQAASRSNGMLVIQGTDNGRAFSITVSEATGALVGAVAGSDEAFVVFGACTLLGQ